MSNYMVTILMAAYNGEKYIAEQIESILNQTATNWVLIIQDDCSTDSTAEISRSYTDKYPDKIRFIQRIEASGSAKNNFASLLPLVRTEYCMTCDNDDVWLPTKIETTLRKLLNLESLYGKQTPLLVHTDLKVVNEQLEIFADSMLIRQRLDNNRKLFNHLLVQNNVTGCTMMVNQSLLKIVGNIPSHAIMHDWWMALVAAAFGHIGFVNETTILYRQHNQNEVGFKDVKSIKYNIKRIYHRREISDSMSKVYEQAKAFLDIYGNILDEENSEKLKAFINIPQLGKIKRIKILHQYDFWKSGLNRKLGQILFI
jgi:glycosyltransferase involved in cell wall biosynthesis